MTATIISRLQVSHRHPEGWDIDVQAWDGVELGYVITPDRAGDWRVHAANDAGWCRWPEAVRAGVLVSRDGGPGTYGHTDLYASAAIADTIARRSEPR